MLQTCGRLGIARGCASLATTREEWAGKPIIGIVNTWSDINACHGHLRERAQDVKRGVWEAGGFPIELPAMSLRRDPS